jgi:hypothetical protein
MGRGPRGGDAQAAPAGVWATHAALLVVQIAFGTIPSEGKLAGTLAYVQLGESLPAAVLERTAERYLPGLTTRDSVFARLP